MKLSELDELEKLYEVNIQVYSLAPIQAHSEDKDNEENTPEIVATLLRRSHRRYSSTIYLNLYENHFSYIKYLSRYSKSFCCSRLVITGKKASGWIDTRRPVMAKSSWNIQAARTMYLKQCLKN